MLPRSRTRPFAGATVGALLASTIVIGLGAPAGATAVTTEAGLRAAFSDASETTITLSADIDLADCAGGQLVRPSGAVTLVVDGAGFTIRQTCPGVRVMRSDGDGLTLRSVTITGGRLVPQPGDGGGGGVLTVGEGPLLVEDSTISGNRADGPTISGTTLGGLAGAIFSGGDLTITNSAISDNAAGGGDDIFAGLGGAFAANGTTLVTDSTISGNVAEGAEQGGGGGGAIFGNGPVTLERSTISGNRSTAGTVSGSGYGAGVAMNGDLTLIDSTVTGNVAEGPESNLGGVGVGGKLTVVYSTIAGNSAATQGANVRFNEGDEVFASVIAEPLGGAPNCSAAPGASLGYNAASDDSCAFTEPTDRESLDPQLGPLSANGGPTRTLLPVAGSPLLDAIPLADCQAGPIEVLTDQRGVLRPQEKGCDIGAVEVLIGVPVTPSTTVATGGPGSGPADATVASPRFTG